MHGGQAADPARSGSPGGCGRTEGRGSGGRGPPASSAPPPASSAGGPPCLPRAPSAWGFSLEVLGNLPRSLGGGQGVDLRLRCLWKSLPCRGLGALSYVCPEQVVGPACPVSPFVTSKTACHPSLQKVSIRMLYTHMRAKARIRMLVGNRT